MDGNYEVRNFFLNNFLWREPRVANFADIFEITTMFIKTTFKHSNEIKRVTNYVSKYNVYWYFFI